MQGRLGRGCYFGRVLTLGLVTGVLAFPIDDRATIRAWVGCEAQVPVAMVIFAGLQCLLTIWSVMRLRDAGAGAGWAVVPWLGALPGLLRAADHPPGASAETLLYAAAIAAVLAIGMLPGEAGANTHGPPPLAESALARGWRRGMLIAILAYVMVVVPRYGDDTPRARVLDGYDIANAIKAAVTETWLRTGRLPSHNAEAGLPPPEAISGNSVGAVTVLEGGRIEIRYVDPRLPCEAQSRTLVLVPVAAGEELAWRCEGGDMPNRYRPHSCR